MPLIRLHSFTNLSPPLISHKNIGSEVPLFCCDSFPPGEAKNSITIRYYRSTKRSIAGASGRLLVDPYSGRVRSTGCLRKTGVTGGFYPPLQRRFFIVHTKRRNHCGRAFYPIYFMVSSPFS